MYPSWDLPVLLPVLALSSSTLLPHHKHTPVDGVHDHEAALLEGVCRPGATVPECVTATWLVVIWWVAVKVRDLFNFAAIWISRYRADIENA